MRALILLVPFAAGCLSVPETVSSACASNDDCAAGAGEVCQEGTCWGDPPEGTFAASITPPAERTELVPFELGDIALPADGWLGDLAFVPGVTYSGRVEAFCTNPTDCTSHDSVDATITITRPSQFHGGTTFKTTVASLGSVASGSSFSVLLPVTRDYDSPYTLTIMPNNRATPPAQTAAPATVSFAQLVPPLRVQLSASATATEVLELGSGQLTILDGKLATAGGFGVPGYRVVALGHWDATAPIGEVSSVAFTGADGRYAITLSDGLAGTVELVATPIGGAAGASLHIANIAIDKPSTHALVLPDCGALAPSRIQVMAADGSGNLKPLVGARVEVIAEAPTAATDTDVYAMADVTTGDDGVANVGMYNGALVNYAYKLRVVPPADANVSVIYDQPISVGDQQVVLASRVALTGLALDSAGQPIAGVAVTAHPALRFMWSLPVEAQAFLAEIPPATTVTDANGEFVVWVDHDVGNVTGSYALAFDPPASSASTSDDVARVAHWEVPEIVLPTSVSIAATALALDPITIPDAAYVHGRVADLDGLDVEGAELKLYRIDTSLALCSQVPYPPPSCPIPAVLQGRGASDGGGIVRLALPRP